jgi:hypothetical protein
LFDVVSSPKYQVRRYVKACLEKLQRQYHGNKEHNDKYSEEHVLMKEEKLTPDQRYIKVENEESGFSWKRFKQIPVGFVQSFKVF